MNHTKKIKMGSAEHILFSDCKRMAVQISFRLTDVMDAVMYGILRKQYNDLLTHETKMEKLKMRKLSLSSYAACLRT